MEGLKCLCEMDSCDEREETLHLDIPKEQMPGKLAELKERAAKYERYKERFASGEEQVLETGLDCRTLPSRALFKIFCKHTFHARIK